MWKPGGCLWSPSSSTSAFSACQRRDVCLQNCFLANKEKSDQNHMHVFIISSPKVQRPGLRQEGNQNWLAVAPCNVACQGQNLSLQHDASTALKA